MTSVEWSYGAAQMSLELTTMRVRWASVSREFVVYLADFCSRLSWSNRLASQSGFAFDRDDPGQNWSWW